MSTVAPPIWAGVSAGVLTDRSLYLGGAIYFLTNGSDDFGLTYGGLLTGWTTGGFDEFAGVYGATGSLAVQIGW